MHSLYLHNVLFVYIVMFECVYIYIYTHTDFIHTHTHTDYLQKVFQEYYKEKHIQTCAQFG